MIDRSAGKVGELGARGGDAGLSILVGIADDRVGVGDIKIMADQRDAKWRIEMVQKDGSQLGNAVTIVSRNSVMRLASFALAPANDCTQPVTMSLGR